MNAIASPPRMQLRLTADLAETERLACAVEDFAETVELPPALVMQLNLVLEELVTNSIKYGYRDGRGGVIEIGIEKTADALQIQIRDDGDAFDPFSAPEPDVSLEIEERAIGGLGIHLIRHFMDSYDYQYQDGHNQIRLLKQLSADEA